MRTAKITTTSVVGYRPQLDVSASKMFGASDFGTHQRVISPTTTIFTVPKDSTVNFDVGTEIEISWHGLGPVIVSQEDSTVPIRRYGSDSVTGHVLAGRYAACVIRKVAANEWVAYGAFDGVSNPVVAPLDTILLTYQLATGINSGISISGWNTYPINTEALDTGNYCSLATNQFTLAAGTYEFFDTRFRGFAISGMNIRLMNITDSVQVEGLINQGSFGEQTTAVDCVSFISGRFTIATAKTFEVQAYTFFARQFYAWGLTASYNGGSVTQIDVYATIGLRRLY